MQIKKLFMQFVTRIMKLQLEQRKMFAASCCNTGIVVLANFVFVNPTIISTVLGITIDFALLYLAIVVVSKTEEE